MLRDYINRFNLKRLEVGECSDDAVKTTFINGLRDKDLIRSVYSKPPLNFDDTVNRAKKFMLANEAVPTSDSQDRNISTRHDKPTRRIDLPGKKQD